MRVETRLRIVNELHVAQRALTSIAYSRLQLHRIHGFSAQSHHQSRIEWNLEGPVAMGSPIYFG